jgi:hypothetical protein
MKVILAIAPLLLCSCAASSSSPDFWAGGTGTPVADVTAAGSQGSIADEVVHFGAGTTRIAASTDNGSGGVVAISGDDMLLFLGANVEGGRFISDRIEVGLELSLRLGIHDGEGGVDNFGLVLSPGVYGRYYFAPVTDQGMNLWGEARLRIDDLIQTGNLDSGGDDETNLDLAVGGTMFLVGGLALEGSLTLLRTGDDFGELDEFDPIQLLFGLSYYY